eukprot:Phypoly_transcript_11817.p1 GENE.Phypoly_transcript_11817~~Phypoly_transcript_11817.p1  ORF type:complete len:283 (+),score=42.88 Phypoly_transcript_11817:74-922(+)
MMNVLASDAPPEDDLTHMSFKDPMWLQTFPLNVHSALDYFALSQFYDKKCNNEILKMQRLEMSLLRNLRGIEYELIHVREPALFVIRKLFRESPDRTIPRAIYYILNGSIYQAPTLFNVLNSRLSSSIFYARESLKEIAALIKFQPSDGHSWVTKSDGQAAILPPPASQKKQIVQYEPLIASLFQKFPPPNAPAPPAIASPAPPQVNSPPTSQPTMPPPSIPPTSTPILTNPLAAAANGIVHSAPAQASQQNQNVETQQIDLKRKLGSIGNPGSAPASKRRA